MSVQLPLCIPVCNRTEECVCVPVGVGEGEERRVGGGSKGKERTRTPLIKNKISIPGKVTDDRDFPEGIASLELVGFPLVSLFVTSPFQGISSWLPY